MGSRPRTSQDRIIVACNKNDFYCFDPLDFDCNGDRARLILPSSSFDLCYALINDLL